MQHFKNRHFSYKRIVYLSLHVPVVIETEKRCDFNMRRHTTYGDYCSVGATKTVSNSKL